MTGAKKKSFYIAARVYYHNGSNPTALGGNAKVTKNAKNADTPKMAEKMPWNSFICLCPMVCGIHCARCSVVFAYISVLD